MSAFGNKITEFKFTPETQIFKNAMRLKWFQIQFLYTAFSMHESNI
jgi:hypothetical protein